MNNSRKEDFVLGEEKPKDKDVIKGLLNDKLIVKNNFDSIEISERIDWEHSKHHNQRAYAIYML